MRHRKKRRECIFQGPDWRSVHALSQQTHCNDTHDPTTTFFFCYIFCVFFCFCFLFIYLRQCANCTLIARSENSAARSLLPSSVISFNARLLWTYAYVGVRSCVRLGSSPIYNYTMTISGRESFNLLVRRFCWFLRVTLWILVAAVVSGFFHTAALLLDQNQFNGKRQLMTVPVLRQKCQRMSSDLNFPQTDAESAGLQRHSGSAKQ